MAAHFSALSFVHLVVVEVDDLEQPIAAALRVEARLALARTEPQRRLRRPAVSLALRLAVKARAELGGSPPRATLPLSARRTAEPLAKTRTSPRSALVATEGERFEAEAGAEAERIRESLSELGKLVGLGGSRAIRTVRNAEAAAWLEPLEAALWAETVETVETGTRRMQATEAEAEERGREALETAETVETEGFLVALEAGALRVATPPPAETAARAGTR